MTRNAGVWIDHKQAIIVSLTSNEVTIETLDSHVDAHSRYSGQEGGKGEKHYEQRHREQLDRYFDDVIAHLKRHDALFIFGPGEAKRELHDRLGRHKANGTPTVHTAAADALTVPQIVAKVKEHFDQSPDRNGPGGKRSIEP